MDAADHSIGNHGRTHGTGCHLVHGYVERSLDYARDDKGRGALEMTKEKGQAIRFVCPCFCGRFMKNQNIFGYLRAFLYLCPLI